MPSRLNAPVLSLDAGKMHHIDPSNAGSLMAMWSIFSKCSETLTDGPRLENMSWRVWSRELLCVAPVDVPLARSSGVPSLSNSYSSDDSLSEDANCPMNSRSRSFGQDECHGSLSRSRHLTPHTLEKIVVTIQKETDLGPLSPSIAASLSALPKSSPEPVSQPEICPRPLQDSTDSCLSTTTGTTMSTTHKSDHRNSDTSVSSDGLIRSGSVVHGFSPIPSSFRSRASSGVQPVPSSQLIPKAKNLKPAKFVLGASSEDDESSFEQRLLTIRPPPQKSSLSQSLSKGNLVGTGPGTSNSSTKSALAPKRTSFRDVVAERRIQEDSENDEGAIESSDEEDESDEVMESAIDEDDEDEGDWEDSNSDDGKLPLGEAIFRRVESRPDLVSRRSMLTLALSKGTGNLSHAYSQPALHRTRPISPPQGGNMAESPEDEEGMMMHTTRRTPIAIPPPNANSKSVAHSPRTTRRNMLSTELTESLRKNLLWERQQKSQAANAFLKRSRNAQSMANLQAHTAPVAGPSQPPPATTETSKNNSWNHYFENPWEYHAKGW